MFSWDVHEIQKLVQQTGHDRISETSREEFHMRKEMKLTVLSILASAVLS